MSRIGWREFLLPNRKMPANLAERFSTRDGRFYPVVLDGITYEYPSVTTVLDMVRVKGFLDQWEAELVEFIGVDGHKKYLEKKANEGTALHNLIEFFLHERESDDPRPIDRFSILDYDIQWDKDRLMTTKDVNNYTWEKFCRWQEWWDEVMVPLKPQLIWTEKALHSRRHGVAGRGDACFRLIDGVWIYDWKSGKSNEKHKFQTSVYVEMENEMLETTEEDFVVGARILTLGEETKKGWKLTEISREMQQKGVQKKQNEVTHYFEGFLLLKAVVNWHCPYLGPNNKSLPRFILPH